MTPSSLSSAASRRSRTTSALLAPALVASLLCAAPAASALPVCPPPPSDRELASAPTRHDLSRERIYFVLPDRFANGDRANDTGGLPGGRTDNGLDPTSEYYYHGGDLRGVIDRLDYIQQLGSTAIWLAPVFKNKPVQGTEPWASAGYHGYWVTDFTAVDPHFGTEDQLRELTAQAHARGIKVFLDIITNHTADVIDYAERADGYRSSGAFPTLDRKGRPVDLTAIADSNAAGGGSRSPWPDLTVDSFPYTPVFRTPADATAKSPSWLNDPTVYHNRGNSVFEGESSLEGDFFGLDDLATQNPRVVKGFEEVYQDWITRTGVDGYRIDTAKHVDMSFWRQWAPAVKNHATRRGNADFFMFGEVSSADPAVTSPYVTDGKLQATLDFPFQSAARSYVSQGGSARALADLYAQDYRYTTARTNAYGLPTFLGNHDMGRFGGFLRTDNPGADAATLLAKDQLGHDLMFLTRGQPTVYYGDEQGFTGAGGDIGARQDLFASRTESYNTDEVIGGRPGSADRYDPTAPLYRHIARLAELRRDHPALADGAQIERYAADGPGVYAFSRIDAGQRTEYVVAVNNSSEAKDVSLDTFSADAEFERLYPSAGPRKTSGADRRLALTVPPLSSVVYKAVDRIKESAAAPRITLRTPATGSTGKVTLSADVVGGGFDQVFFAARVGNGTWQKLGAADNGNYKITHDLGSVPRGTEVCYKAVVKDPEGHVRSTTASFTTGTPAFPVTGPASGASPSPSPAIAATAADVHWIDQETVAWKTGELPSGASAQLVYDPAGRLRVEHGALNEPGYWIRLQRKPDGLTPEQLAQHPYLQGYSAFTIDRRDLPRAGLARRSQLLATQHASDGALITASGVTIPTWPRP
ncbi:alpha-amylase family glycosyl hydrolase [Streptomyces sp. NPDC001389]|uniref:alpha-amylase family glycosyl hydrolase n=1 Tax=unclassified Streptomyces TaxID=2593676 RepID=UPI0036A9AC0A